MKPTSWNSIKTVFFRFAPMGKVENTRFQRNWTTFVNPAFCPAWRSSLKMVVWNRPRGLRSQWCFFVLPQWGKSKKRVLNAIGRRSSTRLFALLGKAHWKWWYETDLVEFDSKGVFSFRPDGESRKNAFWTQLDDVRQPGFLPCLEKPTQNGRMKPTSCNSIRRVFFRFPQMGKVEKTRFERNWTTFVNPAFCPSWKSPLKMVLWNRPRGIRSQWCFFVSPRWGKSKKRVLNAIGRRSSTRLFALLGKAHSKWWYETDLVEFDPKGVFSFRPDGESRKTRFERNWTTFVNPAFCPAWKSPLKIVVWNRPGGIWSQGCFFVSPRWGKSKKRVLNAIGRRSSTRLFALLGKPTQNGSIHTTILSGLFQAGQKAALTNVVQLRSKRVFSTFPIGAKRKNTLGIEFHDDGFIIQFWVGFSKQGKKPRWRTSSNCVQNAFFRLSPSGRNEKTPLGSNSTTSVSYHHFEWAFPSRAKSRVDERRPIAFKTRFFDFPHRGETKKHPFDRIPRGRFHTTILSGIFQAGQKAGLTNVVQLRSKRVFSTFPIGAKRKNTLGIEFHEDGFILQFWVGFSKQGKKPGWRTSSNCVQNAFFRLSPSGQNEKTPLGSNSTRSVSYYNFEWAFPIRAKSRVDERRPIAFKTRFFDFPHRGKTKKHPWDRIPRGRFHTTILSELFQAGQKAGLTNVVHLRSKRIFSTFPIGAKRKNTLGIEFHEVGFIPPFWVGFSKQGKKPRWRTSSNCVQNAFFRLSPSGQNEKTPLGSNSTMTVS